MPVTRTGTIPIYHSPIAFRLAQLTRINESIVLVEPGILGVVIRRLGSEVHIYRLLLLTFVGLFQIVVGANSQIVPPDQVEAIAARIEAGDVNALALAANLRNPAFVPYLKSQLADPKSKLREQAGLIQVGLAKDRVREQLQQIICELDFGEPEIQNIAYEKVNDIGGWFAIRTLARFLEDDPQYKKTRWNGSFLSLPWQESALRSLPLLVPSPPALPPYVPGDHAGEVKSLRQYLQDHRETLQKIEPLGNGLVTSKQACLQILKVDPAIPSQRHKPKSGQ